MTLCTDQPLEPTSVMSTLRRALSSIRQFRRQSMPRKLVFSVRRVVHGMRHQHIVKVRLNSYYFELSYFATYFVYFMRRSFIKNVLQYFCVSVLQKTLSRHPVNESVRPSVRPSVRTE